MQAITFTKAHADLAHTIARVCVDHEPVIITGESNQSVVMVSLEDYSALEETAYLLRSHNNAIRLLDSIAELGQSSGGERNRVG